MNDQEKSPDEVTPCSLPPDSALGQFVLLSMRSPVHRRWAVDDLATNFLPPIGHGQYQLYRTDKRVIGALTWAWLDEAAEEKLLADGLTPPGEAWHGGDRLWFIDFLAPYGHARAVARHFMTHLMPASSGRGLRRRPGGHVYRTGIWRWRRKPGQASKPHDSDPA